MNENLELIREKCIAANPEIVELNFGCEVTADTGPEWDGFVVLGEIGICKTHKIKCGGERETCDIDSGYLLYYNTDEPYEIEVTPDKIKAVHGRPIRLADVLLALQPHMAKIRVEDQLEIAKIMCVIMKGSFFAGKQVSWNLRADDLEKQSEETIDFLYQLLR